MKNVFKEIIIILLLIFAVLLVLSVVLYEYVPANKQLPESVSYVTPQNVKEKLVSIEGVDEDKVILTYEINQTDLYNYQRINEYKPGKTNPFSSFEKPKVTTQETTGNSTTAGTTSTGTTSTGTTSGTSSGTTKVVPSSSTTTTTTTTTTNTVTATNSLTTSTNSSTGSSVYTAPTSEGGVNPGEYTNKSGTK